MYICVYVYSIQYTVYSIHIHTYIPTYMHIYIYICIYIYSCVHVFILVCIHIYIYIYIHNLSTWMVSSSECCFATITPRCLHCTHRAGSQNQLPSWTVEFPSLSTL